MTPRGHPRNDPDTDREMEIAETFPPSSSHYRYVTRHTALSHQFRARKRRKRVAFDGDSAGNLPCIQSPALKRVIERSPPESLSSIDGTRTVLNPLPCLRISRVTRLAISQGSSLLIERRLKLPRDPPPPPPPLVFHPTRDPFLGNSAHRSSPVFSCYCLCYLCNCVERGLGSST